MSDLKVEGKELLEYLSNFNNEAYRKQTLDYIISNKLLTKFFEKPENQKVLEYFTTRISEDIGSIIQVAMDWGSDIDKRTEKIINLGTRAGVAFSGIKAIVAQIEEGERHIKAINAKEK